MQVDEDDEKSKPDNQDWSFKKTSFGWHFKRNSASSSSIATSSGWLSKGRPQVDCCTIKQHISSDVPDTYEDTAAETSNFNDEKIKETLDSSRVKEDAEISSLLEKCHKTHSENLAENEKIRENEKKVKYTIPKLNDAISSNNEDFFDDLEDIDFSEELEGPVSSHAEKSSEDINFSEEFEGPFSSHGEKGYQEAEDTKMAYLSSNLGKTQVHAPACTVKFNSKSKEKRGILYCDAPEPEKDKKDSSDKKYENILLSKKRELKGGEWIDARKMKKKVKSNLLFKV